MSRFYIGSFLVASSVLGIPGPCFGPSQRIVEPKQVKTFRGRTEAVTCVAFSPTAPLSRRRVTTVPSIYGIWQREKNASPEEEIKAESLPWPIVRMANG